MTRHPLVVALLVAFASAPAFAQTAPATPTPDQDAAPATLDTVVVTGTRASNRTVAESLSPIDVITPEALQATGTSELATALARALPSLNFPRPAITDGTDAVRPAQLRGLAPDQVLVLVNGKRRHTTALINLNGSQGRGSSPVDLNAIPIAAVERVEVLRDGASAQYGSDAIAGVVNVVLKGSESGSIEAKYGQMSAGDGAQTNLSGDAGFRFGGERGLIHLAGQVGHHEQTDRARPLNLLATPLPSPAFRPRARWCSAMATRRSSQAALSLNGTWDFSDNLTALCLRHGQQPRRALERLLPRAERQPQQSGDLSERIPAANPQPVQGSLHRRRPPRHRRRLGLGRQLQLRLQLPDLRCREQPQPQPRA